MRKRQWTQRTLERALQKLLPPGTAQDKFFVFLGDAYDGHQHQVSPCTALHDHRQQPAFTGVVHAGNKDVVTCMHEEVH